MLRRPNSRTSSRTPLPRTGSGPPRLTLDLVLHCSPKWHPPSLVPASISKAQEQRLSSSGVDMSLFNVPGALALQLSADVGPEVKEQLAGRETLSVLGQTEEEFKDLHPEYYVYDESLEARGIMLQRLTLKEDAQGFFKRMFHRESTIYVLSWAYHLADDPIITNPRQDTPPVTLRLRATQTSRFLGNGLLIFPARKIRGGIGLNVQVWESHQGSREFGKTLEEINKALKTSKLYDLLAVAAAAATAQPELIAAVPPAADALMGTVSAILRTRGDG